MARRTLVALLGSAVALAVAASATAGTWPKMERNATDQALAKKSILHLSDFTPGSGWTVASGDSGSGSAPVNDPACKTAAFSDQGRVLTGSASSSFKATGLQVWSSADVMKTVAMARHDAAETTSTAVMPCLSAAFAKNL